MLPTPVLFLVFNRPDTTARVFEAIRQAKPRQLFIAADGPRADRPGENEKCRKVREIATRVDWDCEVKTLFRETNLGCGKAVSEAITWFFEQVEEGIILEDDTLPNQRFFSFCEELLSYYREEITVMHIGGCYPYPFRTKITESYFISRYPQIWGWATWRRAWRLYDFQMNEFSQFKSNNLISRLTFIPEEQEYTLKLFERAYHQEVDTWDTQWFFTIWNSSGKCVMPSFNMIKNIGFGQEATHTKNKQDYAANLRFTSKYEIIHPNKEYNSALDNHLYYLSKNCKKPLVARLYYKIVNLIRMI